MNREEIESIVREQLAQNGVLVAVVLPDGEGRQRTYSRVPVPGERVSTRALYPEHESKSVRESRAARVRDVEQFEIMGSRLRGVVYVDWPTNETLPRLS